MNYVFNMTRDNYFIIKYKLYELKVNILFSNLDINTLIIYSCYQT